MRILSAVLSSLGSTIRLALASRVGLVAAALLVVLVNPARAQAERADTPNPLLGQAFGDFAELTAVDGAALDFSAARWTLLRWWTDTCPHCAATLPALEELVERRGDLQVVGVYHPKPVRPVSDGAVTGAARRLGFTGPLFVDPEWNLLRSLQARGLPRRATSVSLLVDREGVIRWIHPGPRIHPDTDGRHRVAARGLADLETALGAAPAREPKTELWRGTVGRVPFVFELRSDADSSTATIHNGSERIVVPTVRRAGNELTLRFDHYDSEIRARVTTKTDAVLEGTWRRRRADGDSVVQFRAERAPAGVSAADLLFPPDHMIDPPTRVAGRWAVQFERDEYPAVAVFEQNDAAHLTGTFLTALGDYRYLAGRASDRRIRLSCFDGAHAFYFEAVIDAAEGIPRAANAGAGAGRTATRLEGTFRAEPTWTETWVADWDPDAALADAWTLTKSGATVDGAATFADLQGAQRRLDDPAFVGPARLLVVFGTWCPNCKDATAFLQELDAKYRARGLRILGLAFEHERSPADNRTHVARYAKLAGAEYPMLVAGLSSKPIASQALPWLDEVRSYPTFVFADAQGAIKAVYTGFSGPATGAEYAALRQSFEQKIEGILQAAGR